MTESSVTLRMPAFWSWLFGLGLGAVGFGLGFIVKPLFNWMINLFDSAPGPLRVVAALPTIWAVAILTLLGLVAGAFMVESGRKASLVLTVDAEHVELAQNGEPRYVPRAQIASVYRDRKDLVLIDEQTREVARNKADDLQAGEVRAAFQRFGYDWLDDDPFDRRFDRWVDGHPDLAEPIHKLLRERGRAKADGKAGAVGELTERLQQEGVVVRDRDDVQQCRRVGPT